MLGCAELWCGFLAPLGQVGVAARRESLGETLAGLQEMLMYGLKGMAAYTHHAGRTGPVWGSVDVCDLLLSSVLGFCWKLWRVLQCCWMHGLVLGYVLVLFER